MGVTINSVSTGRQAGAEHLLLDSGAQLHACPITFPGQKIPLPDPTRVQFRNQFCLLVVSLSRGTGVIFVQTLVHCSFLTRSRRNTAKHCCTRKRVRSVKRDDGCALVDSWCERRSRSRVTNTVAQGREFVLSRGMMVAPLSTAGVSDEVAQELQMPMGPQMLEDVEEPMPARSATVRDPGTPDQIVMEQHSLPLFPSQLWCKMCVESRGQAHREQSKIDAVVPQLQFDYGYMGDGGLLQIACFLVVALEPSTRRWCPTPRRWTCPMLLRQQPNWCVTWV